MKRYFIFNTAVFLLVLLLTSCGGKSAPAPTPEPTSAPAVHLITPVPAETPQPPEATAPEAAPEAGSFYEDGSFPGGLDDDGRGDEEYDHPAAEPVETIPLDADRQYVLNLFLSNFAEQHFRFYCYDLDMSQIITPLVKFAHIWCKVNDHSAFSYGSMDGETYEILTVEQVDKVVNRYFPFTVTEESAAMFDLSAENSFYQDGRFFFPAADGESYNRFAVASSLVRMSDDTYTADFVEYEIDLDTYFDFDGGIPSSYYRMTPAEADAAPELTRTGEGTAIVIPYSYDGRNTYQLVEYTVR